MNDQLPQIVITHNNGETAWDFELGTIDVIEIPWDQIDEELNLNPPLFTAYEDTKTSIAAIRDPGIRDRMTLGLHDMFHEAEDWRNAQADRLEDQRITDLVRALTLTETATADELAKARESLSRKA